MKRFQNGLSSPAHCVFSWLLKASNNPGLHLGGKVFRRVLAGGLNSDLLVVGDVTTHPMRGEEVGGFISSHPCFFFGLPDTPCRQLVAAAVRWWVLSALYAILWNPMRYVRERRAFFYAFMRIQRTLRSIDWLRRLSTLFWKPQNNPRESRQQFCSSFKHEPPFYSGSIGMCVTQQPFSSRTGTGSFGAIKNALFPKSLVLFIFTRLFYLCQVTAWRTRHGGDALCTHRDSVGRKKAF